MQYINFNHLPKCDQNWATMPKIEGGRLCEQCDTKMIDFSGMTNLEIIKIHAETEGRVCGHYLPSQLSSPFQEKKEIDQPSFLANALLGLTTMATTLFVNPSTSGGQVPVEKVEQNQEHQVSQRDSGHIGQVQQHVVLKGQVIDDNATPLPFASVYVKETDWGVSADEFGLFTLILNKDDVCKKDSFTLVYFYLGFKPVERDIDCTTIDRRDIWLGKQGLEANVEVVVSGRHSESEIVYTRFYAVPMMQKKKWWQKGFLGRVFRKRK